MSGDWGVVSTIKASVERTLHFAAWYLELGATHLLLHLDDPEDPAGPLLESHPRITVIRTDDDYWQLVAGKRPRKHQVRQTTNATRIYRQGATEWLAHLDVDEFLLSDRPVRDVLSELPGDCWTLRIRPTEALCPVVFPNVALRGFSHSRPERQAQTGRIYPEFGRWLDGGMLSHVAGKLFVRRGLENPAIRIHNAKSADRENPGHLEATEMVLAHLHCITEEDWLEKFDFRHDKGAYRADLKAVRTAPDQRNLHDLLTHLAETEGRAGLIRFFRSVAGDTPALRQRLDEEDLLHIVHMDVSGLVQKHFPDAPENTGM